MPMHAPAVESPRTIPGSADAAPVAHARAASVSVSIVSHRHGGLLVGLLRDLAQHVRRPLEVIVTCNVPERLPFDVADFPFPIRVIENTAVRGFAANHNHASGFARNEYLCVLNPDVRLVADPFGPLVGLFDDPQVGVAGPVVLDPSGALQDHARRFPTFASLLGKAVRLRPRPEYEPGESPFEADWIAGMFMLFRTAEFRRLGGFDDAYFLYYEDVDLCARLRAAGRKVCVHPGATVIHDASRRSWRHPYYAALHLRSMMRFFRENPTRACRPIGESAARRRIAGETSGPETGRAH